ncbi:Ppx/GppA family phosphatase [Aureimonas fodinaquatilis]|uniref:Ppx/GppA family phosphatase n=2 Tax=Aureimonas fodinaquatilis TaxID=2565783 RepID=A0A5B0E1K9_9HYPH|nr:Ppx/GppA family phosphatase [Aureimonas fodinaquatilis]
MKDGESEKASISRLSKRQRRRRRKPAAPATAHADLPPVLGEKVEKAEAALARQGGGLPAAPRKKQRRRRRGSPAAGPAKPQTRTLRPAESPTQSNLPIYAALDLGTNNCRLLVAVPGRPGQFRVIDAFSRIVRLGEGLSRTGSLAKPAMDRALAALTVCRQKLAARRITGLRLIATEACRSAANGEEFLERVHKELGLDLEIVSRETEARLAVSGCGSLVDRAARGAVLFDIGGGSSEIALLDLSAGATRRLSNHIVDWTSLPVGVVSLAERYGGRNVSPEQFQAMVDDVSSHIAQFPGKDRLAEHVGKAGFHLLGTSGTVTTLAGVHLGLERYDRRQVDGLWLRNAEVSELVARICDWSFEERIANPCIGSERADLVLAGCAILEAIRRQWPAPVLRVADRGLREGLLIEMMVADGVWRRESQQNRMRQSA